MPKWWCLAVAWWCLLLASSSAVAQAPPAQNPLQAKCQDDFTKLTDCMDYGTGQAGSPSSTCCSDAGTTQKARPVCLCYIIQLVHSGKEMQTLGLRFDRLLALPTACKLANANVTLCINLLHLTPSSPDYALFANASKITPSTNTPATGSSMTSSGSGARFMLPTGIHGGVAAAVISAVLSSIFF